MAQVTLDKVSKKFGRHTALNQLSLDVRDGEFFVLLGPTGAGKTTTLRLIAGLDSPTSGSIHIDQQDVGDWSAAQRDVALVFQYYSLYPHYTVRQNLEFPLRSKVRNLARPDIEARVARAAKTLRIEHLLERKTDRLSGGEMQRVSIGRAIVREPRVFLMDEPLSNLDAKLREILRAELKDLQMKLGATFLYVTHDQVEAMSMGDRVAVLNAGRIVQAGTPQQIYNHPRDTFVAAFVGSPSMNLLPARVADGTRGAGARASSSSRWTRACPPGESARRSLWGCVRKTCGSGQASQLKRASTGWRITAWSRSSPCGWTSASSRQRSRRRCPCASTQA